MYTEKPHDFEFGDRLIFVKQTNPRSIANHLVVGRSYFYLGEESRAAGTIRLKGDEHYAWHYSHDCFIKAPPATLDDLRSIVVELRSQGKEVTCSVTEQVTTEV